CFSGHSAAAPATVSGEPLPNSHWARVRPGRWTGATTREPGDRPELVTLPSCGARERGGRTAAVMCVNRCGVRCGAASENPVRRRADQESEPRLRLRDLSIDNRRRNAMWRSRTRTKTLALLLLLTLLSGPSLAQTSVT